MNVRVPAEVFPPGEFLRDELEKRGWSQIEFAEIIERPVRLVNEILAGKRGITPETAKEIGAALGTSPHYWLNLEAAYRLGTEPVSKRILSNAALRAQFPMTREMVKRGWIVASKEPVELEANVLQFYRIPHVAAERSLAHAAMRNEASGEVSPSQEAWLYRVRQVAEVMPLTATYTSQKLRAQLEALHALTTAPEEARHVPRLLAECGVRFVVVEPFVGSKIDGACLWLSKHEPVVGMSLRYNRIDNFWFVLRHELEHVLRGDGQDAPIIDSDLETTTHFGNDRIALQELAANTAAANFCVPAERLESFVKRKHPLYSKRDVLQLAYDLRVHPGIVAGQLRRRLKRYELFAPMLAKIREIVVESALTDGYGYTLTLSNDYSGNQA